MEMRLETEVKVCYWLAAALFVFGAFLPMMYLPGGSVVTLMSESATLSFDTFREFSNFYIATICYFAGISVLIIATKMGQYSVSHFFSALLILIIMSGFLVCQGLIRAIQKAQARTMYYADGQPTQMPGWPDTVGLGEGWLVVALGLAVLIWAMYRTYRIGGMNKIQAHHVEY